jgi:hypothetical protein
MKQIKVRESRNTTMTTQFSLNRNSFGQLTLTTGDGLVHENVRPVRAFPIQAPDAGISLVCEDGREVAWIDSPADLPTGIRSLVDEELQSTEFMPVIQRIIDVTSFATPCTWQVETDRGQADFVLRGEEDIRRIDRTMLLIADTHGIHFLIRDMAELDKHSRKILDRFL